jgi:ubiquitin-conjugating enzyme E2 Z|tara:strand:+ start:6584 stop:7354 length:771 start_codon:yes stop_codon:yes gene_type:complete
MSEILSTNDVVSSIINEPQPVSTIVLSRETTKRLLKDIKEIIKQPLDSHGIYYKHDETNILKGYAYISGPPDTQYFAGNYFFEIQFPEDYPHSPPKVEFKTNDGETRFHPNMYRNGKMCLSILNTWKGDQWTGCQSIRTILLTIISVMDNMPLLHEPGFTKEHNDVTKYNKIIYYKNFDFTINSVLSKGSKWSISPFNEIFKEEMKDDFVKNKNAIMAVLEEKKVEELNIIKTGIYNMSITIDWKRCYDRFIALEI